MCNNTGTAELKNGSDTEVLALPSFFSCFGNQFRDRFSWATGRLQAESFPHCCLFAWFLITFFFPFLPLSSALPGLLGQKEESSVLRRFLQRRGHVLEFGLDGYMQKVLLCVWIAISLSL